MSLTDLKQLCLNFNKYSKFYYYDAYKEHLKYCLLNFNLDREIAYNQINNIFQKCRISKISEDIESLLNLKKVVNSEILNDSRSIELLEYLLKKKLQYLMPDALAKLCKKWNQNFEENEVIYYSTYIECLKENLEICSLKTYDILQAVEKTFKACTEENPLIQDICYVIENYQKIVPNVKVENTASIKLLHLHKDFLVALAHFYNTSKFFEERLTVIQDNLFKYLYKALNQLDSIEPYYNVENYLREICNFFEDVIEGKTPQSITKSHYIEKIILQHFEDESSIDQNINADVIGEN